MDIPGIDDAGAAASEVGPAATGCTSLDIGMFIT
ncbi:hypothetical protein HDF09_002880 [Edaphobacter lichenicola]|uniref:Uncharacterized protein n=1 Tax=Tunturiibacter empetritectus TaxID=3069691 RepID=A0A7W8IJB3_9BACT|nr:hypothetical protein [Edaphobacter lichenicola]